MTIPTINLSLKFCNWDSSTFKKKKEKYALKMRDVIEMLKEKKIFPYFREKRKIENLMQRRTIFPFWKIIEFKRNYYMKSYYYYKFFWKKNYEEALAEGKFADETTKEIAKRIYDYLMEQVKYQKKYLLYWKSAKKYNNMKLESLQKKDEENLDENENDENIENVENDESDENNENNENDDSF